MIPSLDIVIVNWNTGHQLYQCLESIAACDRTGVDLRRVVVVDNGSTDSSLEGIEKIKIPLVLRRNPENKGFSRACNQGAGDSSSDFLLFLNPDTRLLRNSIMVPAGFLGSPNHATTGIVGIQLVDSSGRISRTCARFPTARDFLCLIFGLHHISPNTFKSHHMVEWDHSESREVNHVMGSFYLVRGDLFRRLKGFDERYFVYLEDLDFSLRASLVGYSCYYVTEASAFHKGGGASEQVRATRLFYAVQSRIQYVLKNFSSPAAVAVCLCTLFVEPVTRTIRGLVTLSVGTVKETLIAFFKIWAVSPRLFVMASRESR